jgi:hypothetical protein
MFVWTFAAILAASAFAREAMAPAPARAQNADQSVVAQAGDLYTAGKFKEAAELLKGALDKRQVPAGQIEPAREMLARALVKSGGARAEARQTFASILQMDAAYRPDPNRVPPDEIEVFDEALRDFQAEQLKAGQRVPASISFFFGHGKYSASAVNDAVKAFDAQPSIQSGGADEIKGDSEFGGSVRFPIRPKLSLDIELSRFRSTTSDRGVPSLNNAKTEYEIAAMPLAVSAYYGAYSTPKLRVNAFAGAGPMLVTQFKGEIPFISGIRLSVEDTKTGVYAHAGIEGEYLLASRLAVTGRVLGRYAKASKVVDDKTLEDNIFAPWNRRDVDFSGIGLDVGLRAYIGY